MKFANRRFVACADLNFSSPIEPDRPIPMHGVADSVHHASWLSHGSFPVLLDAGGVNVVDFCSKLLAARDKEVRNLIRFRMKQVLRKEEKASEECLKCWSERALMNKDKESRTQQQKTQVVTHRGLG